MIAEANATYGELKEDLHLTGYAFERGCQRLRNLLTSDGWKICGAGFASVDDFLASLQLDQFAKVVGNSDDLISFARARGLRRCGHKLNFDGATTFVYFDVRELATVVPGVVVSSFPPIAPNLGPYKPRQAAAFVDGLPLFDFVGEEA